MDENTAKTVPEASAASAAKPKKVVDPAIADVLKKKKARKREEARAALKVLVDFAIAKGGDAEKAAAKKYANKANGVRAVGGAASGPKFLDVLNAMFAKSASIHEDRVWTEFKLGRAEMRKHMINAIKKPKAEDRLWIEFNAQTATYTLKGKGKDAPTGWTGYKPLTVEGAEIK